MTTSSSSDGLDERAWEAVCKSASAAHRGDAGGHVAPLLQYERDTPEGTMLGFYLWFLLRYRAIALIGYRPNLQDLEALAQRNHAQFSKLIRGDPRQLEDTLLTVFELSAEDRKVKGGDAVVMGSAALGVLLDDPRADLAMMRPDLAAWWQRRRAEFGMAERR